VRWLRAVAVALLLPGIASPRPLRAEEEPPLAQLRVVRIQVDGDPDAISRTRAVASELFERLGVTSLVSGREPDFERMEEPGRKVLARAYFDLRDPATPEIVVVDAETEREIVRRTLPESASLEISVEELTHVLYAVVEGLLQTARSRLADVPAKVPAAPPPPAPETPRPEMAQPPARRSSGGPSLSVGAFGRLVSIDSSTILPGGGLALAGRSREDGLAYGGALMAAMHASNEIVFEAARGGVRPLSLRAYGTVSGPTESGVSLLLGLGGGVDLFRIESDSAPPDASTQGSTVVDAILSSLLGAHIPIGGRVSLDAAFTLDLDLTPRRFVMEQGGRRTPLLELSRFRPAFVLGGSYSLVGSSSAPRTGARP
jgi:hypothetical protein